MTATFLSSTIDPFLPVVRIRPYCAKPPERDRARRQPATIGSSVPAPTRQRSRAGSALTRRLPRIAEDSRTKSSMPQSMQVVLPLGGLDFTDRILAPGRCARANAPASALFPAHPPGREFPLRRRGGPSVPANAIGSTPRRGLRRRPVATLRSTAPGLRHAPRLQPSNSRRKRAPCAANSSCDGASGRQIDAAFAISTVPGVKELDDRRAVVLDIAQRVANSDPVLMTGAGNAAIVLAGVEMAKHALSELADRIGRRSSLRCSRGTCRNEFYRRGCRRPARA